LRHYVELMYIQPIKYKLVYFVELKFVKCESVKILTIYCCYCIVEFSKSIWRGCSTISQVQ